MSNSLVQLNTLLDCSSAQRDMAETLNALDVALTEFKAGDVDKPTVLALAQQLEEKCNTAIAVYRTYLELPGIPEGVQDVQGLVATARLALIVAQMTQSNFAE